MRKVKDFGVLIATSLICICIVGGSVLAEDGEYNRRSHITSKGVFEYSNNTVVLDSSDLTYLADEIDELERAYKSTTMEALNQISTFYASTDGDISHDHDNNNVTSDMAVELSFSDLYQGIIKSQSVDHLDNVQPATADNLTAGTAAWVDGNLLVGTGADNTSYYDKGYDKGLSSVKAYLVGQIRDNTTYTETTSYTFDCTSIPNYRSMNANNFVFRNIRFYMYTDSNAVNDRSAALAPTLSYNASNGRLTISNCAGYLHTTTYRLFLSQVDIYAIPNLGF